MLSTLLIVAASIAGPETPPAAASGGASFPRGPSAQKALGAEEVQRRLREVDEKAARGFLRVECPASSAQVEIGVEVALAAYQAHDSAKYDRLRTVLGEEVACLTEVASPALVRDLHLLQALQRISESNPAGATLALRGLRTADPAYRAPVALLAREASLKGLLEQAKKPGKGDPSSLLQPQQGALLLDGVSAGQRPPDRAALVQWAAPSGQICWSGYLDPGQPLPSRIVAGASTEGGLLACLQDRKAYEHASVDPIVVAPPAADAPDPEESDSADDFFGDMARMVEGGEAPMVTAPSPPTPAVEAPAPTPAERPAPAVQPVPAEKPAPTAPAVQPAPAVQAPMPEPVEQAERAEVPPPPATARVRRLRPQGSVGGVLVAAGDPDPVRWEGEVQPGGFATAGFQARLGLEARVSEHFGLFGGLGGILAFGAGAEATQAFEADSSHVYAGEARLQAALHIGRLGVFLGPLERLGTVRGSEGITAPVGTTVVGWTGHVQSLGLALDLDVDLGKHVFAGAGGSFSMDGARAWSTVGLGAGWRL